ncbi:MAG: hypothetical protein ABIN80_14280 [Dyadobacter sp.]|uniref:hypothetical protein n=1 Tax=Dyadobacter sp. TaxID=1914288 RepID=UPI0032638596
MKTYKSILTLAGFALLFAACQEKVVIEDSPLVTIKAPTKDQVLHTQDSIKVDAQIDTKNSPVENYRVDIKSKKGKMIASFQSFVNSDSIVNGALPIKRTFFHKVDKSTDLVLEITAKLKSGNEVREAITFKLTK